MAINGKREPLAWGIILIVIGALFLFHNLDIGIWDLVARLWPLILIVWGAWKLYFGLKDKQETGEIQSSEEISQE
jgi:hypothetical protein